MSSFFEKSDFEIGNAVLNLIVDISSNLQRKISCIFVNEHEIFKDFLHKNNIEKRIFSTEKVNYNFETKEFYIKILYELYEIIFGANMEIKFNSYYSLLYALRINNFLKILLTDSNLKIAGNPKIKIYLYLLFLHITGDEITVKKLNLNEGFFVGTFEELKREYPEFKYKDSIYIENLLNNMKKIYNDYLENFLLRIFQKIISYLNEYGNINDDLIKNMNSDSNKIIYKLNNGINDEVKEEIKKYYENNDYLIILNYFSYIEYKGYETNKKIDLKNIKKQIDEENYEKNYIENLEQNNINTNITDLEKYDEYKNQVKSRNILSFPKLIAKMGFDDEIVICSLLEAGYNDDSNINYQNMENIKINIDNLYDKKTKGYIEEILSKNELYESFFSIINSDIIKTFFTSHLFIGENDKEFTIQPSKIKDSECFENAYNNFITKYNKPGYNDFKNLIIIKILTKGTRACVLPPLKKYIINPSQLYIGANINNNDEIKEILKGYLLVILLHETEHFLRTWDEENKNVFASTPREREGGRLFIKHIFGLESINRINCEQAEKILNLNNWKNHEIIKSIFENQKEESDINKYYSKIYPKSISFYLTKKGENIKSSGKSKGLIAFKK